MREVIMRMDGSGEESHGLERVGELVRCGECRHYDSGDRCTHPDGLDDARPSDYCSKGRRRHENH